MTRSLHQAKPGDIEPLDGDPIQGAALGCCV
jgi:hypothetical protein